MQIQDYRRLTVWQRSMEAATEVYTLVKKLPKEELFAMSSQMRRAAVSIPSNIAEGNGRPSAKDCLNFLGIAYGSKSELQTQLQICVNIGYLSETDIEKCMALLEEVERMLYSLMRTKSAEAEKK